MLGKVGEKWWKEDRSGGPDTERQRVAREGWHYCCVQSVPFCLQQTGFIQNPPWIKLALETGKPVSLNETRTVWLLCGELKPDHPPVFSRCVGLITGAQPYVKITSSIWGLFLHRFLYFLLSMYFVSTMRPILRWIQILPGVVYYAKLPRIPFLR